MKITGTLITVGTIAAMFTGKLPFGPFENLAVLFLGLAVGLWLVTHPSN